MSKKQVKSLLIVLGDKVEEVDGRKLVNLQVLVDLINSKKMRVALVPEGPPDGG